MPDSSAKNPELHFRSLVVDSHVDTTQRLYFDGFDLSVRAADGCVDIPRLKAGGIDAVFFALWVPGTITGPAAVKSAFGQINAIHHQARLQTRHIAIARTAADILQVRKEGKIALLLAVEGGHMIDSDMTVLRSFASLGASYMTLTHSLNTEWADSSTDTPVHHGLTDFGKQVIREMNRLGMMVDISHVSDKAFCDALSASEAPVIASHSNCRALCATPRNLTDEMIGALAAKGGVMQINFHTGFLSQRFRDAMNAHPEFQKEIEEKVSKKCAGNQACQLLESERLIRALVEDGKLPRVEWTEIVDHIDHAVRLVGVDHVGVGSDFDGANMPYGMEDASCCPRITEALLARGYSDSDIEKILGGNTLRLMQDVEAVANQIREQKRETTEGMQ